MRRVRPGELKKKKKKKGGGGGGVRLDPDNFGFVLNTKPNFVLATWAVIKRKQRWRL